MPEHTEFVYLPVETFRKLTPHQKEQHVDALKQHLDAVREDQSPAEQERP
jgi:hypothetical protein